MCFGTSSGRLSQLCHFGPIIAIFLISFITLAGLQCLLQWWPPVTLASQIHLIIYLTWPLIIFYNYFNAVFLGPGFVPFNWRPENPDDEKKLQFCKICNSFKAPRSHHCKKCKRCVFKMDHHCPWINTCCGHLNHASFVYFLFSAPLGCLHAAFVIAPSVYRAVFRSYYMFYNVKDVPIVNLSLYELVGCMFALGMSFGVIIAVGILFYIQLRIIMKNMTGIEDWIAKKARHRREHFKIKEEFIYPYDLGLKENLRQVFNWTGNFRPIGDGFSWNILECCDQFTFSVEQLSQKEEKRTHAIRYIGCKEYDGSACACSYGCKTCCCLPWTDEPRMPVNENDLVLVTRWQKHWYYGEKVVNDIGADNCENKILKGWFPAKSVKFSQQQQEQPVHEDIQHNEQMEHQKQE